MTAPPTEEQRELEIARAYLKGAKIDKIVQDFNLTGPPAVYSILRRANVPRLSENVRAEAALRDPDSEPAPMPDPTTITDEVGAPLDGAEAELIPVADETEAEAIALDTPSEAEETEPDQPPDVTEKPAPPSTQTDPLDEAVRQSFLAGKKLRDIMTDHGIGQPRVHSIITRLGLERTSLRAGRAGRPANQNLPERDAALIKAYQEGLSNGEIISKFQTSYSILYKVLEKYGVPTRRAQNASASRQPKPDLGASFQIEAENGREALEWLDRPAARSMEAAMPVAVVAGTARDPVIITEHLDFTHEDVGPQPLPSFKTVQQLKMYRATRIVTETVEIAAPDFLTAATLAHKEGSTLIRVELQG